MKIFSAILVNPFPLIVIFRSLSGSSPIISECRSDAMIGCGTVAIGCSLGINDDTFGADGASIHISRRFASGSITFGILKFGTFGNVDIRRDRIFGSRSNAPT